ncbi:MAG TPA: 4-hydroxybenzoate octaprenyltransferase [Gammaproteobacteria bacterium]|nr:4-hydroxybenzoate octaprenyltransferase [Gammaproteobacteria bacterium]
MTAAGAAWGHAQALLAHYSRYWRLMRLHRPIGIWLLLWPTLWALWIASAGRPDAKVFLILVLGTIVVRSAGCVINDFADRKIDPHVARTADRPLATGEVHPVEAVLLFGALMVIALGLVLSLNRLTLTFALAGAFLTIVYPFTKRFLSTPQFVLGVAFSWGVPMAFAATAGDVPRVGWLLFLATVIWVVVYDTQYAMTDRPDDIKLGVRSTAILFGELDRAFIVGLQALFLASLVLVGRSAAMGPWYYGGLGAGCAFCLYQAYLIKERDIVQSFRAFLNNAWLGASIFAGILLDYTFRL